MTKTEFISALPHLQVRSLGVEYHCTDHLNVEFSCGVCRSFVDLIKERGIENACGCLISEKPWRIVDRLNKLLTCPCLKIEI